MKVVFFTGNTIRHKYQANALGKHVDDILIVSECNSKEPLIFENPNNLIEKHFQIRHETEKKFFPGNDIFLKNVIPLIYKETNLPYIYEIVKEFDPDFMISSGSSIIKGPLLSLLKPGNFINLHLGLSPYYRGSGTNFWPFVNNELQFVGATMIHIDAGIDTGDIIFHMRPKFELNDNVHTIGCKIIKDSVKGIIYCIDEIQKGNLLNRTKQWEVPNVKNYRRDDFNLDALTKYEESLKNNIVKKFLENKDIEIKLVS